jgi:hypothetical protein
MVVVHLLFLELQIQEEAVVEVGLVPLPQEALE